MLSGYDAYAGYYNQDGTTTYAYDPNTYTAPATSAAPAEAATTAPTASEAAAEASAAATVVVPLPAAAATTSADATATASDAPAKPAPLSVDQTAAAAQEIGAEHAANLLSVDEKQNLEQQQEAAETARKEAEERYQKAEEQRRNAKVPCTQSHQQSAAASDRCVHMCCTHMLCMTASSYLYLMDDPSRNNSACLCTLRHVVAVQQRLCLRLHTHIQSLYA